MSPLTSCLQPPTKANAIGKGTALGWEGPQLASPDPGETAPGRDSVDCKLRPARRGVGPSLGQEVTCALAKLPFGVPRETEPRTQGHSTTQVPSGLTPGDIHARSL